MPKNKRRSGKPAAAVPAQENVKPKESSPAAESISETPAEKQENAYVSAEETYTAPEPPAEAAEVRESAETPEAAGIPEADEPVPVREEAAVAASAAKRERTPKEARRKSAPVSFGRVIRSRLFGENPVLGKILAVCTVLAVTTSLKNGLLLVIAAVAVTIPLYVILSLFTKRLPGYLFYPVAALLAAALVTPVCMAAGRFVPEVTGKVSFFLPITAVNALLMLDMRTLRGKNAVLRSLAAGFGDSLGYSAVILVFSIVREILGAGTLYGRALPSYARLNFSFLLQPPAAFLLVGFAIAIYQAAMRHARARMKREAK